MAGPIDSGNLNNAVQRAVEQSYRRSYQHISDLQKRVKDIERTERVYMVSIDNTTQFPPIHDGGLAFVQDLEQWWYCDGVAWLPLPSGGGRPYATKTIAAFDSDATDKANADFVCDGVDDQVEILAAIAAANRGNLTLLDGNYYISAPIAPLFSPSILIQGSGIFNAVIQPSWEIDLTNAFHMFVFPSFSYIEFRDFTVESQNWFEAGEGDALHFNTSLGNYSRLSLRNMSISGWTWGVWGERMHFCTFEDSYISGGNDAAGPYVGGGIYGDNWWNSTIENCGIGGATYGIQLTDPYQCRIVRNDISFTGSAGIRLGL